MTLRTIIICFLLLQSLFGVAQQSNEKSILLRAHNSTSGVTYKMNVTMDEDSIRIGFLRKDSVSDLLQQDKYFKEIFARKPDEMNKLSETQKENLLDTIFKIEDTYTWYTTESVQVKRSAFPEYAALIQKILDAPKDTLQHNDHEHIVLDGTGMRFLLYQNGHRRTVSAVSPGENTHPLLYAFITQTTAVLRRLNPDSMLHKKRGKE